MKWRPPPQSCEERAVLWWACPKRSCLSSLGEHAGVWFLDLKSGSGSAGKGDPSLKADVVMKMDSGDFNKMFAGERRSDAAAMATMHSEHHRGDCLLFQGS